MRTRPAPQGWRGRGLRSRLLLFALLLATPSQALDLTDLTTLYNPNCVQWAIVGPCFCNLYTPCVLVTYWEPGWLVETVKQPGTTTLAPMESLMTAAWGALGLPPLGGGGAGEGRDEHGHEHERAHRGASSTPSVRSVHLRTVATTGAARLGPITAKVQLDASHAAFFFD